MKKKKARVIGNIFCSIGLHKFSFQYVMCAFIDKVSGRQVNDYVCACGKTWLSDGETHMETNKSYI